ncbi:proteophosphoglycan ppg4 [Rhodotorula toruloides]|uniref:Proteophosphoglycan ppg4 n=1 Tax=Rhodotorula toruloides TaxID=5286 RepID=A0A511KDK7_RHOTO|nr:proteophosphoglycan ppg4 [Rhodotorula toruloides]
MSASGSNGLGDWSSLIPAGAEWIEPNYEEILQSVAAGQSPYLVILDIVRNLYHPDVPPGFTGQLYFLLGLFAVHALILVFGLAIRLAQGRLWFFTRLDRTVVLPNTSTLYGFCAIVYAALGIVLIVASIDISRGGDLPRWYQGMRVSWFGCLWVGAYFEIWSTLCGWYIRKKGAFYKESSVKTVLAILFPLAVVLIAWVPPLVLFYFSINAYNHSYIVAQEIVVMLEEWQKTWTPAKGLEIDKLATLFTPGSELGHDFTRSLHLSRAGHAYLAGILLATFAVYLVGISLEVAHLSQTVSDLRAQAKEAVFRRNRVARPSDLTGKTNERSDSSASIPSLSTRIARQLDEEQFAHDGRTEATEHPWTLLAWVRRNRLYSAGCIATLLLVNAGIDLWQATTRMDLRYPSGEFIVEMLISCWMNGILSTVVALLLLFRSLDASTSPFLTLLRHRLPFLPFPPAVTCSNATRSLITTEPPRYAAAYATGSVPLVERTTTRSFNEAAEGETPLPDLLSERSRKQSEWNEHEHEKQGAWNAIEGSSAPSSPRAM